MLWTAFMLGFVGSLHCAGMCGPLAMAVPVVGTGRGGIVFSRLIYNLGRVATYATMGLLIGLLGQAFALAGVQRWISLTAGALILAGVLVSSRWLNGLPLNGAMASAINVLDDVHGGAGQQCMELYREVDGEAGADGNLAEAARALGVSRQSLHRLVRDTPALDTALRQAVKMNRKRCPTCAGRGTVAA